MPLPKTIANMDDFRDSHASLLRCFLVKEKIAIIGEPMFAKITGIAYLYEYSDSGKQWVRRHKFLPKDNVNRSRFGGIVGISDNAKTVVISNRIASVHYMFHKPEFYVFEKQGEKYVQVAKLETLMEEDLLVMANLKLNDVLLVTNEHIVFNFEDRHGNKHQLNWRKFGLHDWIPAGSRAHVVS